MYKPLVNNKEQCATIVEKQDTSPSTVQKCHKSYNTTNKDLTRSHWKPSNKRAKFSNMGTHQEKEQGN